MSVFWIVLIVVLVVLAAAAARLYYGRNKDVVSEVKTLNPGGDVGTAFVVYHPGKSDFQRRVISGFAEGLVSNGWRVEITTASDQAPTDLSGCDLLVLGGPTYVFTPNRPIRRYLDRLGDLGGQRTVIIITAMGAGNRSTSIMESLVREANGDLVKSLLLYKMRPNDDDNYVNGKQNRALAVEMATRAAKDVPHNSSSGTDGDTLYKSSQEIFDMLYRILYVCFTQFFKLKIVKSSFVCNTIYGCPHRQGNQHKP